MPDTLPVLQGRFLLQQKLGEGGMAEVWRAYDNRLGVWRAVKLLLPDYVKRTKLRRRFESEARAMALLEHPNIVRVYDVGSSGAQSWIVMELCDGGSLEAWLDKHGPMAPRVAVTAALQVAAGIGHAHAHGVIHRDIKPQNVLVSAKGECKVTDFGIAHFEDESLTRTGTVMGTLGFMAPEQRSDAKKVDRRSDIYSVGATLFTLLTGRIEMDLFAAGQDPSILAGIPGALDPVIAKAVAYHRNERYQSIEELSDALRTARDHLPPDPKGSPRIVPPKVQRPPAPSIVERALAEASSSAPSTTPPLPGETLMPSYDLFEGASIPPSLARAARRRGTPTAPTIGPDDPTPRPSPAREEPRYVIEEEPPGKVVPRRGAEAIPWVPRTERRQGAESDEEHIDFDSLYVHTGGTPAPVRRTEVVSPPPGQTSGSNEDALVFVPEATFTSERTEEDEKEDPSRHAGHKFDVWYALREAWNFITQVLTGMLEFASSPFQYLIWPVVAVIALATFASFQGANSVVTAQTRTSSSLRALTYAIERSGPEVIDEITVNGGNREVLDAHWERYETATTDEAREEAAVTLSRLLEEQFVRLEETDDPRELRRRKELQSKIQAITRQRTAYAESKEQWRDAADTTTGKMAVSLGLAGKPPPPE